ncbi:selenocysteine-specific translation elongation factor [Acetobacter orientalis]|uniref:Selenocysteine-specific translation elongation factor n=1 Tax=Acetobacter orientalis TaxID=146474 RepID=A0A2Z5ZJI9_9PROT|nr:selenocysteine-specific translation elongation factor [Acetobacter orientalis]
MVRLVHAKPFNKTKICWLYRQYDSQPYLYDSAFGLFQRIYIGNIWYIIVCYVISNTINYSFYF